MESKDQIEGKKKNGKGRKEGLPGCLDNASRGPTCEGAGPCSTGPISTYLRSPGLLPQAPESCDAHRGAESLAEHYPVVAATSSPTSLQPWGSLVGLSLPSSSASYSYSRYPIAAPLPRPERSLEGGRGPHAVVASGSGRARAWAP